MDDVGLCLSLVWVHFIKNFETLIVLLKGMAERMSVAHLKVPALKYQMLMLEGVSFQTTLMILWQI